jgi:YegS/Rv2252/BmrU family lipid kinase
VTSEPEAKTHTRTPTVGVLAHEAKSLGDGLAALRRGLADAGHADPPWRQVDASKKAPKQVRRLLEEGIGRLLVWGGDGTVRRCVDEIVAQDATVDLAILPAGTANLLAHALDIPIDLDGALDVALGNATRAIDVGVMNGEAFVVMAGTGFDALMIRDAEDGMKDRFGKLSYLRSGARHLGTDGARAKVDVDGERWFAGPAACVLVGNVGSIVGGVRAFPNAQPDDGRLDVGVVTAQTRRDWLRVGVRAITGHIDASPFVEITQGTHVRTKLDRKLPWQLDGGNRPPAKKFDVSVLPRRLSICVGGS